VVLHARAHAALLAPLLFAAGCGGGGRSRPPGDLAGLVTDVDGQAVAGATVSAAGRSTTTASNGSFRLQDLPDGYVRVVAEASIRGRRWSGESLVDLIGAEQNRSLNLVISEETLQGAIEGTVISNAGFAIEGAKVFVGGPLGSTLAVTDRNGLYRAPRLTPGVTYTVTASLAGYVNHTKSVHVSAGSVTAASFTLDRGDPMGAIPGPDGLTTQAWTVAAEVTRAASPERSVYEWLKRLHRRRKGLPDGPLARQVELKRPTRATPAGSLVEADLFWTYASYEDLFGYLIRRGVSAGSLEDTAVLRDPLTRAFFDLDPALTPGIRYFYAVHRLDTIDFPARGTVGSASNVASATPLAPIRTVAPAQGASVGGEPLLSWTAVAAADTYQIYVWDRFPDLQNSNDPSGVSPVWPADPNAPGSSLVKAPGTSQRYEGPALTAGRTYYWFVVASNADGSALSVTPIRKFTVR